MTWGYTYVTHYWFLQISHTTPCQSRGTSERCDFNQIEIKYYPELTILLVTVYNCPNTEKYRVNKIHIGRGKAEHYPLPLPYMGKPDPRALQETIRQQRAEIKALRQQVVIFRFHVFLWFLSTVW
jgi:hypothetical protein